MKNSEVKVDFLPPPLILNKFQDYMEKAMKEMCATTMIPTWERMGEILAKRKLDEKINRICLTLRIEVEEQLHMEELYDNT